MLRVWSSTVMRSGSSLSLLSLLRFEERGGVGGGGGNCTCFLRASCSARFDVARMPSLAVTRLTRHHLFKDHPISNESDVPRNRCSWCTTPSAVTLINNWRSQKEEDVIRRWIYFQRYHFCLKKIKKFKSLCTISGLIIYLTSRWSSALSKCNQYYFILHTAQPPNIYISPSPSRDKLFLVSSSTFKKFIFSLQ